MIGIVAGSIPIRIAVSFFATERTDWLSCLMVAATVAAATWGLSAVGGGYFALGGVVALVMLISVIIGTDIMDAILITLVAALAAGAIAGAFALSFYFAGQIG